MPLAQENGTIKVIMHDPLDFETIDKLRFVLNREIEVALAPKEAIVEAINKYYGSVDAETESVDSMLQEFTDTAIDFAEDGGDRRQVGHDQHPGGGRRAGHQAGAPDHPGSRHACGRRDIHIEPFADRVRIRYRIDGVLMERDIAPRRLLGAIVSRLKIMGSIDIAEKRRPQDGRIKILVAGKDIDLRVSILPTSHGQSVVMRILDRDNIKVGLQDLGFGDDDFDAVQATDQTAQRDLPGDRADRLGQDDHPLRRAQRAEPSGREDHHGRGPGRVLPARGQPVRGEGQDRDDLRTHHPGHAAAESEHPPGRRNPRSGDGRDRNSGVSDRTLGFQYTAHERCAQCHYTSGRYRHSAVPGRQLRAWRSWRSVWCARSAPNARCRYEPPAHISGGLGLRPEIAKKANFMKGKGCSHCNKKGYRGRMGIFELMTMTTQVREMTFKGESTQNVRRVARKQGMRTLFEDGMIKAIKGHDDPRRGAADHPARHGLRRPDRRRRRT